MVPPMKPFDSKNPRSITTPTLAIWLGLILIGSWASRSVLSAWAHDPALQTAPWIFLAWVVAWIAAWRASPTGTCRIFPTSLGGLSLALGILGDLQAAIYLGFVGLLLMPIHSWCRSVLLVIAALTWMPAWSWAFADPIGPGLPWFNLGIGLLLLGISFTIPTARS
jgi:hypothetical protein